RTVALYLDELRSIAADVKASNAPAFGETPARLNEAIDSLDRATQWLLAQKGSQDALAGATPYLRLFGNTAGGCLLAEQALAALRNGGDDAGRAALAHFFADNIAVLAAGLELSVTGGAGSVLQADAALGG
ncbi:MAG TPA: acyl-CoA dehydrogenase C-terminal domain-containing protein, partial [Pseudolabrys sp.]|nr:acyl-CoA dehydrogenase C-terminal domain-containing protein [Pseudolabrys sp.]